MIERLRREHALAIGERGARGLTPRSLHVLEARHQPLSERVDVEPVERVFDFTQSFERAEDQSIRPELFPVLVVMKRR